MILDTATIDMLRQISEYLSKLESKPRLNELGKRLAKAADIGAVERAEFTMADVNLIHGEIVKEEFFAVAFADLARQPPTSATSGAAAEAEKAKAEATRLQEYKAAVAKLV